MGDDLSPEDVTALLGSEPTKSETKGQEIVGPKTGRVRAARSGSWRLKAKDREPEDLDGQIFELLDQLTDDLGTWKGLGENLTIDLFVGLFMTETNEGMSISPEALNALAIRGISLGLDVYCPLGQRIQEDA